MGGVSLLHSRVLYHFLWIAYNITNKKWCVSILFMYTGALYLDNNNLTGSIPEAIFRSPSLTQLHLYSNALNGRLPSNMDALTNLGTYQVVS